MARAISTARSRWAAWVGYAACAWAFVFAAVHFYWAVGGSAGADTIGPAVTDLARDPWFVAIGLWGVGGLFIILGLIALALVRPWGRRLPRWPLLAAAWVAGVGMALYGGALLVQHGLMLAGVASIPAGLGATAARWHLLLWDPWWLLGGVLYLATAWLSHRRGETASGRGPSAERHPGRSLTGSGTTS